MKTQYTPRYDRRIAARFIVDVVNAGYFRLDSQDNPEPPKLGEDFYHRLLHRQSRCIDNALDQAFELGALNDKEKRFAVLRYGLRPNAIIIELDELARMLGMSQERAEKTDKRVGEKLIFNALEKIERQLEGLVS